MQEAIKSQKQQDKPSIHLIGIGGSGLSAIATVLLQQGYTVSGSDVTSSSTTQRLAQLGASIFIGHRAENLQSVATETQSLQIVVSSAIPADNPELQAAQHYGLPVFKRAEWLGRMTHGYRNIAVAGTHGKTTTTAMMAFLLKMVGQDPTYIVGGFVPQLETNAAAGKGDTFVIEADEYDHTFLGLHPEVAMLTTIEWDHPDIFSTPKDVNDAFVDFVRCVDAHGLVIGNGDDPNIREVLTFTTADVVTYGLKAYNDWQIINTKPNRLGGYKFKAVCHRTSQNRRTGEPHSPRRNTAELTASLAVPGLHNVYNALAVLITADYWGIELPVAAQILEQFKGVKRRFELKGEVGGVIIVDDYAHHPTEVRATLAAARLRFPKYPLWVVFQPHTFSRTYTLLDDFANAFKDADHVLIVDIFASRETDQGLVSSQDIVKRMIHPDTRYIGSLAEVTDYLVTHLNPPAVLITMGAGDSYKVGDWVLEQLDK